MSKKILSFDEEFAEERAERKRQMEASTDVYWFMPPPDSGVYCGYTCAACRLGILACPYKIVDWEMKPEDKCRFCSKLFSKGASAVIKPEELSVVAGPTYEHQTESGPETRFNYYVVWRNRQTDAKTLIENFEREQVAAEEMAKIAKNKLLYANEWSKGDPWDGYHQNMSLEERWAPFGSAWQAEQEGCGR
jgi:hypothetical protein